MKKIVILLLSVFILSNQGYAKESSDGCKFIYDFTDALHQLEKAASLDIKDASYGDMLKNLQGRVSLLKDAEALMEKWLDNQNRRIKICALYMYSTTSVIKRSNNKLIEILNNPLPTYKQEVTQYILEQSDYWNKLYESTGYALWVAIKENETKDPKQKIVFLITPQERREAIKYIDKTFAEGFSGYEKLRNQKKKGAIKEFNLPIPVWSALYLKSFLSADTYAQIDKIDYLTLTP